jgi:predicted dehydrogenase
MSEQELPIGASGREAGQRSPTARAGGVGLGARLRYGVIGYSYWDPQLTRNRDRLPLARVTHIAELAPDRRQAAEGDYPAARVTESVAEVLGSDVDGSAVVTPIRTHSSLAKQAIEADKHVFIHVSWLSPSKIRGFSVVGDRQMVVYDDVAATDKIRVFDHDVDAPDHTATYGEFQLSYRYGDIVSPHIDWAEPLAVEARDFTAAIREGRSPRSDGREGLRVVRVLEARDRSLASGGAFVDIGQEEP